MAFVDVEPPTPKEVTRLVESLARRVVKALRKRGLEDAGAEVEDGLDALRLESLQQSFALGRAREAAGEAQVKRHHRRVATAAGISLHADTWCHANDRESLEELCRGACPERRRGGARASTGPRC